MFRSRYPDVTGNIQECRDCGHGFLLHADAVRGANAEAFGNGGLFSDAEVAVYRRWARERLKVLTRHLPPEGKRVLEIGPGGGEFLYEAARAGYSIDALDRYDNILPTNRPKKFRFIDGDAESFRGHGDYDAVVAFHVLEHFHDPRAVILRFMSAVRCGGFLFFEVPNYSSTVRLIEGHRWNCFLPYHVQHFTPKSLRRLCEQDGLRCTSISTCGAGGLEELAAVMVAYGVAAMFRRPGAGERLGRDGVAQPLADVPRRHLRSVGRRLYWTAVQAARWPLMPLSAIERRVLRGSNLRLVARCPV